MFAPPVRWITAALIAAAVLPTSVRADSIDFTSGGTATVNGAYLATTDTQPTGTGVIQSFVRIQMTGSEQGYNTDVKNPSKFQYDEKFGNFTHSLPLNTLQSELSPNGVLSYKFLLDINETKTTAGELLSMNAVQIYLGNAPNLLGFTPGSGFGSNSTPVYNLDGAGDVTVELNYSLNSGSGSGDLLLYVPKAYFDAAYAKSGYGYVYLYSAFGNPNGSDAGFEEWATQAPSKTTGGGGNPVPAPPGLVLAGMGFGCLLIGRLRRK